MKPKDILTPSFKALHQQLGHKPGLPVVVPSNDSDFCHEVIARGWLTSEQVAHAVTRYRLGRSRSGKCIFWMIDERGVVRDGHIGKRWASEMLRQRAPELISRWYPEHCFFGLHLLNLTQKAQKSQKGLRDIQDHTDFLRLADAHISDKVERTDPTDKSIQDVAKKEYFCDFRVKYTPVCVVEKESSAVILSELFPDRIWLATVYPMNFNVFSFEPLRGHRVTLFPHTDETMDAYMSWLEIADEAQRKYGLHVTVSDLLEQQATAEQKAAKIDLADFLFAHV